MNETRSFKASAVVSSILLLGGWVSYRAGAWDGLLSGGPPPGPPAAAPATSPENPAPGKPRAEITVFSSSKRILVPAIPLEAAPSSPPPASGNPAPPQPEQAITVFSGSKTLFVPAISVEATETRPTAAHRKAPVAPVTDGGLGEAP